MNPVRWCGTKYLKGIREPCGGFCCGLGKDGKPDPELTRKVIERNRAWGRIIAGEDVDD